MSMLLTPRPTTLPRTGPSLTMLATAPVVTLSARQPSKAVTVSAWPTHFVSPNLPNELLTEIFLCAVQQAIASAEFCLFSAKEPDVCSRLRLTGKLGNRIVCDAARSGILYQLVNVGALCATSTLSDAQKIARVEQYLKLTKDKPLTVILAVQHQEDGELPPYVRPVLNESHRWAAVTVHADLRKASRSLALTLNGKLGQLTHVEIEHADDDNDDDDDDHREEDTGSIDFPIFKDAPALTSVTITGTTLFHVNVELPYDQLRSISVADIDSEALLNLLYLTPQLRELAWFLGPDVELDEVSDPDDWKNFPVLSHLATFVLEDATYAVASGLFDILQFPALRDIVFTTPAFAQLPYTAVTNILEHVSSPADVYVDLPEDGRMRAAEYRDIIDSVASSAPDLLKTGDEP
ncbi:hypothetical protein EV122DRAFT_275366 [Schizophyllum commune]